MEDRISLRRGKVEIVLKIFTDPEAKKDCVQDCG